MIYEKSYNGSYADGLFMGQGKNALQGGTFSEGSGRKGSEYCFASGIV